MRLFAPVGLCLLAVPAPAAEPPVPLPAAAEAREACVYVAARGAAIASELVKDGRLDANNDGTLEDVRVGEAAGTMHGEVLEFRKLGAAHESAPIDFESDDYQRGDYLPFGARWFARSGKVYTLYFESEDLSRPVLLGFIDRRNREHLVCEFSVIESEVLQAVSKEAEPLCKKVTQGVQYLVADAKNVEITGEERQWTHGLGALSIDFNNRGKPSGLALLAFDSSAGRGCRMNYFDAMRDGAVVDKGAEHETLMRLQEINLADFFPNRDKCGGNGVGWFRDGGKIYFDQSSPPLARETTPFHVVSRVEGTEIETLCKATFSTLWSVKAMGPSFK